MIGQKMTLRNLGKRYGAHCAVHSLDLEIGAGEFLSVVGPSGSGKTTLLTMIAGFETPSAGRIAIGETDVTALAPNRRQIGMVFQKYALFPHMTVRKNIEFPLRMRGDAKGPAGRRRVDEMLELVHLSDMQHRLPHQLSGGQQQRVAVARALVFDPPVILMDEPLGALDKKLREAMQFEIKRIQQRLGATVIYVTHDQEEALTMSDRVAVMRAGRLEQVGAPSELYADPASPFVADFVGSINFISGIVAGRDAAHVHVRLSERAIVQVPISRDHSAPIGTDAVVRLAVRPQHISILRDDERRGAALAGTVETLVYAGAFTTAHVRLHAATAEPLLRVLVPDDRLPHCHPGTSVALSLDAQRASLFDEQRASAA